MALGGAYGRRGQHHRLGLWLRKDSIVGAEASNPGRTHARTHACMHIPSTSQQHGRRNCSGFLKEEIKTPGNILHLLSHLVFMITSVLFLGESSRAALGSPLAGNSYGPRPRRGRPSKRPAQGSRKTQVINCFLGPSHRAAGTATREVWSARTQLLGCPPHLGRAPA